MPKDTKKNRYFQVGVGWDSWTLEQLEADAKLHQMDDQPAKLIILRLTEYYKLVERGVIIPGVTAMMQPPQAHTAPVPVNGHSNGAMPGTNTKRGSNVAVTVPREEQSTNTVAESDAAADNADAAFDFFKMDDDEEE